VNYFVIGEREIVLAFGLVGVKGAEVVTKDEALKAFNKATGQEKISTNEKTTAIPVSETHPKVLILTEEVSQLLESEVLAWQKQGNFPLIVEVPGIYGPLAGKKSLTDSIREAIGIQI
jgi:V/A-type H+-transporting ATPase subunit F